MLVPLSKYLKLYLLSMTATIYLYETTFCRDIFEGTLKDAKYEKHRLGSISPAPWITFLVMSHVI